MELSKDISMANFFDDTADKQEVPVVPEKVKVGEDEYTLEELQSLVSMGKMGKEVEERYNTKLDRVYPAFTKTTQELKELKEKLEQQAVPPTPVDVDEEVAIKQAREAAKRVGLVTSDDIADLVKKELPNYYKQQRESEKILDEVNKLEGKINGSDGRPAFKAVDMLEFMRDSGISNAETAYKVRYEKELDGWKEKQLSRAKKGDLFTNDRATTPSQPTEPRPNKDNLEQMIKEALYGQSE